LKAAGFFTAFTDLVFAIAFAILWLTEVAS
jgi:hypothetical protein